MTTFQMFNMEQVLTAYPCRTPAESKFCAEVQAVSTMTLPLWDSTFRGVSVVQQPVDLSFLIMWDLSLFPGDLTSDSSLSAHSPVHQTNHSRCRPGSSCLSLARVYEHGLAIPACLECFYLTSITLQTIRLPPYQSTPCLSVATAITAAQPVLLSFRMSQDIFRTQQTYLLIRAVSTA